MSDNGPNIGQGPEFDAKERRWQQEREQCMAEFSTDVETLLAIKTRVARNGYLGDLHFRHGPHYAGTVRNVVAQRFENRTQREAKRR